MARTRQKFLSILMALIMIFGLLSTAALADESALEVQAAKQIVDQGGSKYYKANGSVSTVEDYAVKVSKTVNPTGIENQFTIDLEVETTQDLEEINEVPDAAVVLVYDSSGSMGTWGAEATKAAAARFLETFVEGVGDAQRKVAMVEFGTIAQTILGWTEANDNGEVSAEVQTGLDKVQCPQTYYACYEEGEHTCTNTVGYCTMGSVNSWDLDLENGMSICKQCGYTTNVMDKMAHYHCTVCRASLQAKDADYLDRGNFAEAHQHSGTYVGPHSPLIDAAGALDMAGDVSGTGGTDPQTNRRGALMLARNLLLAGQKEGGAIEDIDNVYVILLSDGSPTMRNEDNLNNTNEVAFFSNYGPGEAAQDIPALAKDIQGTGTYAVNPGAKFFVVGYTTGMSEEVAGVEDKTAAEWLQKDVGVDKYYYAKDSDQLVLRFEGIAQLIKVMATAWVVTDPMPSGGFVTFAEDNTFAPATHAQWDADKNQVVWDLKQMMPTPGEDDGTFTYNLSYDVILHPEQTGFQAGTAYPTNGAAELKFFMLDENDTLEDLPEEEIQERMQTVSFAVPQVKGYLGSLAFTKVGEGEDSPALAGAEFALTHENCACGWVNSWTATAISSAGEGGEETGKGEVSFPGIPSGHSFTLTETKAPEGYAAVSPIAVTVRYGEVTTDPAIAADGKLTDPVKQPDQYLWQIVTHYTRYNYNGGVISRYDITLGSYSQSEPGTKTVNPSDYVICPKDNLTYSYQVSANNVTTVNMEDPNQTYTLELFYELRESAPPSYDPPDYDPPERDPNPPSTDLPDEEPPLEDLPDEEPPLEDLPDEEPPLEDLPDEEPPLEDLPDEEPPLADVPKTGDGTGMWAMAAAVSGLGLVWLALTGKKRREKDAD